MWAVLLCRHTGQEEGVVDTPYHGRDAAGTEGLLGYFVNVLALRIDAPRRTESGGRWRRCFVSRATRRRVMRHAILPFQSIVHELLPRWSRDASRNAVFQARVAWVVGRRRGKRLGLSAPEPGMSPAGCPDRATQRYVVSDILVPQYSLLHIKCFFCMIPSELQV